MTATETVPPRESLTQRIHRVYRDLPEGERKAADLVLDSPGDLAALAATELAGRAGVSNATVSRLFRRLGYESYDEARRASRAMRAHGSPLYLTDTARRSGRGSGGIAETVSQETALVEASLAMANPITVMAVAERLAKAQRVRIAGFRNSRFIADYARATLAQFRPGVEMLNGAGQTLAEGLSGIGAGDMVLIVGLRRRPAGFVDFVRATVATGADVALLADASVREAPALVRWNLTCAVTTAQSLDSYVGALALLRHLAVVTLDQLGAAGRRHLEKIETIHDELSELE